MRFDLWEKDFMGDIPLAHLTDEMDYQDLRASQEFRGKEANQYFERMKAFSGMTINEIIDQGFHPWHFYRTNIKGIIKKVFDSIDPKIAKANPMIFHFALDPSCKTEADRVNGLRNARIYFMVGYNGMIHPLFFDPYHELNPMG